MEVVFWDVTLSMKYLSTDGYLPKFELVPPEYE
jgi:hypothetical protein